MRSTIYFMFDKKNRVKQKLGLDTATSLLSHIFRPYTWERPTLSTDSSNGCIIHPPNLALVSTLSDQPAFCFLFYSAQFLYFLYTLQGTSGLRSSTLCKRQHLTFENGKI